jgi:hypothetical protein
MNACPKCGHEVSESQEECPRCGLIFSKYKPPEPWIETEIPEEAALDSKDFEDTAPSPEEKTLTTSSDKPILAFDCPACKSEKAMIPEKIAKHSKSTQFFGHIVNIICLIVGIIFLVYLYRVFMAPDIVFIASLGPMAFLFISMSILGFISKAALAKRKVYKCQTCGYILERD